MTFHSSVTESFTTRVYTAFSWYFKLFFSLSIDYDRPRFSDDGTDGSRIRRHGRSGAVEQRAHWHLRDQVLLDVAVQTARVLQLERGRENTETFVRNKHHRQNELYEHAGRGKYGGMRIHEKKFIKMNHKNKKES